MRLRALALLLAVWMLTYLALPTLADASIVYRHAGKEGDRRIALTFDDGPHPRYTKEILDILEEFGVEATFFVVGVNAETYPELIRRALEEGHEIGNHSYNHYHISELSAEAFARDLNACNAAIQRITGERAHLFRPPEGVCTDAIKSICSENSYTIVMWSVDTRDWAHTPVDEICRNVRENAKDGSIILMHDFIGKNSPTPAALRRIIPMLQESGFEFVTISQLLER